MSDPDDQETIIASEAYAVVMPTLSDDQIAELKQAWEENAAGSISHLAPLQPNTELVEALSEAHRQVDSLLAQLVMRDKTFMPSQSPFWPEVVRRVELIRKYGGSL
jgi:hypothetical protein